MSNIDFEKLIFLSSVQLNQLDAQGMPVGFASGVMINYSNKHLLLTVSHATGNNKNWAIQLKYVPGNGTLHHGYFYGCLCFNATDNLEYRVSFIMCLSNMWQKKASISVNKKHKKLSY